MLNAQEQRLREELCIFDRSHIDRSIQTKRKLDEQIRSNEWDQDSCYHESVFQFLGSTSRQAGISAIFANGAGAGTYYSTAGSWLALTSSFGSVTASVSQLRQVSRAGVGSSDRMGDGEAAVKRGRG